MNSIKKYSQDFIDNLINKLNDVPNQTDDIKSKADVIKMLMPTIKSLKSKGYNLNEIVEILNENDFKVTRAYLSSIISFGKKKNSKSNVKVDKNKKTSDQEKKANFQINEDSNEI